MKQLLFALLAFPMLALGQTSVTTCGTLSSAGTYTLQNNISAAGTCLTISAKNVVLNLNGYTITYDTSYQGTAVCGTIGPSGNCSGIHITYNESGDDIEGPGTITQGAGNDAYATPIYAQQPFNMTVNGITINYSGNFGEGIQLNCGSVSGGFKITNNTINPITMQPPSTYTVSHATWSNGLATVTVSSAAPNVFESGMPFVLSGVTPSGYNVGTSYTQAGAAYMTGGTSTTFTYALASNPGSYLSGGTVQAIPTHYGGGFVIDVNTCGGTSTMGMNVSDNTIQGTGVGGIGWTYGYALNGQNLLVSYNTIQMSSNVRDAYAIGIASSVSTVLNFEISYNTITQTNGRGIIAGGNINADSIGPNTGTIHDNVVSVYESCDAGEYGCPGDAVGIQLRFGAQNIQVYNNTVTTHAGATACPVSFWTTPGYPTVNSSTSSCIGQAIKLMDGQQAMNNVAYNNIVHADTTDISEMAYGLYGDSPLGVSSSPSTFRSNTVYSNSNFLAMGGPDGGASGITWDSNNMIEDPNPQNLCTLVVAYYTASGTGNVFLANSWSSGLSLTSNFCFLTSTGTPYSFYVKYYLTATVQNAQGQAVSGATVTATSPQETVTGTTNASGVATLALTDYLQSGVTYPTTSNQTSYTPHTVTASMQGCTNATANVTMTSDQSITLQLGGFPISLNGVAH
jgi:hypothetical protein